MEMNLQSTPPAGTRTGEQSRESGRSVIFRPPESRFCSWKSYVRRSQRGSCVLHECSDGICKLHAPASADTSDRLSSVTAHHRRRPRQHGNGRRGVDAFPAILDVPAPKGLAARALVSGNSDEPERQAPRGVALQVARDIDSKRHQGQGSAGVTGVHGSLPWREAKLRLPC